MLFCQCVTITIMNEQMYNQENAPSRELVIAVLKEKGKESLEAIALLERWIDEEHIRVNAIEGTQERGRAWSAFNIEHGTLLYEAGFLEEAWDALNESIDLAVNINDRQSVETIKALMSQIENAAENQKEKNSNVLETSEFNKMSPEQNKLVNEYVALLQEKNLFVNASETIKKDRDILQSQITAENFEEYKNKLLQVEKEVQEMQLRISTLDSSIAAITGEISEENKHYIVIENPKSNKELREEILEEQKAALESKEDKEFTLEEIKETLFVIDGIERPSLSIKETVRSSKGEIINVTFGTGEKEIIDGQEYEVTYLLTIAGQRYHKDGTPSWVAHRTMITKDYDEGMGGSSDFAEYRNGQWVSVFKP